MTSAEYWKQRELENIAADYVSDEIFNLKVRAIYERQLSAIQKEIDSFYQRYAFGTGMTMAEAHKAVSSFDVKAYDATAKNLVKTRDFSPEANAQLKLYNATMRINRLELLKSNIGLHLLETSDDISGTLRDYGMEMATETYRRQAGILGLSVDIDVWKRAGEIVSASFLGATYSEAIWGKLEARIVGGVNILYAEISKLLEQYLISGRGSIDLARDLRATFGRSRYETERLARTEIRRMQTAVQEEFMRENGIEQYRYIAEATACHICKPLDDKIFNLSELQVGVNASPMHPNCRCAVVGHIDRSEFEQDLAGRGL